MDDDDSDKDAAEEGEGGGAVVGGMLDRSLSMSTRKSNFTKRTSTVSFMEYVKVRYGFRVGCLYVLCF